VRRGEREEGGGGAGGRVTGRRQFARERRAGVSVRDRPKVCRTRMHSTINRALAEVKKKKIIIPAHRPYLARSHNFFLIYIFSVLMSFFEIIPTHQHSDL